MKGLQNYCPGKEQLFFTVYKYRYNVKTKHRNEFKQEETIMSNHN